MTNMWHEARKQEKFTKKIFNDFKKRARARNEESKDQLADNAKLYLKLQGNETRITVDNNSHKQANRLVECQNIKVDRFDVRMFMQDADFSNNNPTTNHNNNTIADKKNARLKTVVDFEETSAMKRALGFERYCLLIQNEFSGFDEEKKLKMISKNAELFNPKNRRTFSRSLNHKNSTPNSQDKAPHPKSASISYNYNLPPSSCDQPNSSTQRNRDTGVPSSASEDIESNFSLDEPLSFDKFSEDDLKRLNEISKRYGLDDGDFVLLSQFYNQVSLTGAEICKELERLTKNIEKKRLKDEQSLYYGPALPTEINDPHLSRSSSCSSRSLSPVRQRSPRAEIFPRPSRNNSISNESPQKTEDKFDKKNILDEEKDRSQSIQAPAQSQTPTVMKEKKAINKPESSPLAYKESIRTRYHSSPSSSSSSSSSTLSSSSTSSSGRRSNSSSSSSSSSKTSNSSSFRSCSSSSTCSKQSLRKIKHCSPSLSSLKSNSSRRDRVSSKGERMSRDRNRRKDVEECLNKATNLQRRASTPLAYKRNRRSSRSLSRELKRLDKGDDNYRHHRHK